MRLFEFLIGLCVLSVSPALAPVPGSSGSPATVRFTITKQGTVVDPQIALSSGSAVLDQTALTCVLSWKYEPGARDGQSVDWPAKAIVRWDATDQTSAARAHDIPGEGYQQKTRMTNVSPEIAHVFDRLIASVETRCPQLYPVRPLDMDIMHARNRVVVRRQNGGAIEATISQSSTTPTADAHALRCAKHLAEEKSDLPPTFAVEVEIDWAVYYRARRAD